MVLEIILGIIILMLVYSNWNQLKKVEYYEDYLAVYEEWVDEFSNRIQEANVRLKQIDSKGTFEADDEVGYFFKMLKESMENLNIMNNQVEGFNDQRAQANQAKEETQEEK